MKTIEQMIEFPGVSARRLFDIYTDSEKHSGAIRAPVSIDPRAGGEFRAFGDRGLRGTILYVDPTRMLVQTWRSPMQWKESELDSVLILVFEQNPNGGRIRLVHSGIPERDYDLFNQGWHERYWKPWNVYLSAQQP